MNTLTLVGMSARGAGPGEYCWNSFGAAILIVVGTAALLAAACLLFKTPAFPLSRYRRRP